MRARSEIVSTTKEREMIAFKRQAIDKSIKKWEENLLQLKKNVKYHNLYHRQLMEGLLLSSMDCPLCDLYFMDDCKRCPIKVKTGHLVCGWTPYVKFMTLLEELNSVRKLLKKDGERLIKYCEEEIKFLKSL